MGFGAYPVFLLDGTLSPLKSRARIIRFSRSSGTDLSGVPEAEKGVSFEQNSAFRKCVEECVTLPDYPHRVVYMAAKKYYFGVGGGSMMISMAFRGRGRGRGGRGFGGGGGYAKQEPFELFPVIGEIATAEYFEIIVAEGQAEKPDIERYSDRNLQKPKLKLELSDCIKLDHDHVPAELIS
ncbi:hypothetical protein CASFOL_036736 [Castilleja foliolosa]|uniref:Uncharacterized protein n=1 Tax=Castilleja foliolosa TaxID=1961234 RepID=A0ABD3BQ98_9LAMI